MDFFAVLFAALIIKGCSALPFGYNEDSDSDTLYPAKSGQFPHHVFFRLKYSGKFPICDGVLIENNYAITSAGCVSKYEQSPDDIEIVGGALSTNPKSSSNSDVQIRDIEKITIHPNWATSNNTYGDLALLKISTSFNENQKVAKSSYKSEITKYENCALSGFGNTEDLHYRVLEAYDDSTCQELLNTSLPAGTFCAGSTEETELLTGEEYAGCPIGEGKNIYGIATTNRKGLFTSTSYHKDWIETQINGVNPDDSDDDSTDEDESTPAPTPTSSTTTPEPTSTSTSTTPGPTSTSTSTTPGPTSTSTSTTTAWPDDTDEDDSDDTEEDNSTTSTTTSAPPTTESPDSEDTDHEDDIPDTTTISSTTSTTTKSPYDTDEDDSDDSEDHSTPEPTTSTTTSTTTESPDNTDENDSEENQSTLEPTTTSIPTTTEKQTEPDANDEPKPDPNEKDDDNTDNGTTTVKTTSNEDQNQNDEAGSKEADESSAEEVSRSASASISSSSRLTSHLPIAVVSGLLLRNIRHLV